MNQNTHDSATEASKTCPYESFSKHEKHKPLQGKKSLEQTFEHRLFPTFPSNSVNVTETKWGFQILLSSENSYLWLRSDHLKYGFTSHGCLFRVANNQEICSSQQKSLQVGGFVAQTLYNFLQYGAKCPICQGFPTLHLHPLVGRESIAGCRQKVW